MPSKCRFDQIFVIRRKRQIARIVEMAIRHLNGRYLELTEQFIPILYVKAGCPSCFKLRLFLLETGQIERLEMREFAPGDLNEAPIKAELAPHFEKVTFPTVQLEPGVYKKDSDELVEHFASQAGVAMEDLPHFGAYADILLPRLRRLSRENKELKARLETP